MEVSTVLMCLPVSVGNLLIYILMVYDLRSLGSHESGTMASLASIRRDA